jgi:hypothetical protein
MYTYGAIKYITNLKSHLTLNLERFMVRAVFALYPNISRKEIWAIINGIMNDRNMKMRSNLSTRRRHTGERI